MRIRDIENRVMSALGIAAKAGFEAAASDRTGNPCCAPGTSVGSRNGCRSGETKRKREEEAAAKLAAKSCRKPGSKRDRRLRRGLMRRIGRQEWLAARGVKVATESHVQAATFLARREQGLGGGA